MKSLTNKDLRQFTEIERWIYHKIDSNIVYTDGLLYVAEVGKAHWLIDTIASFLRPDFLENQQDHRIRNMIFWQLKVSPDKSAVLEARAEAGCDPFISQKIEFIDFPLTSIDIWTTYDGERWIIYLPREH